MFPLSVVMGAAVPAAVCRWGLCPRCPGVGRCLLGAYVGNPGFGIHCHPLDSVHPGFIWRALGKPLGFLWIHVEGFIKSVKNNLDSGFVFSLRGLPK